MNCYLCLPLAGVWYKELVALVRGSHISDVGLERGIFLLKNSDIFRFPSPVNFFLLGGFRLDAVIFGDVMVGLPVAFVRPK